MTGRVRFEPLFATLLIFLLICPATCTWLLEIRKRNKRMNKEREKVVRGGAASYVAECPGASASPHILPIFEMDMRVRGQPGRIGMIWGVRLGQVFPSLSCPVNNRVRPAIDALSSLPSSDTICLCTSVKKEECMVYVFFICPSYQIRIAIWCDA